MCLGLCCFIKWQILELLTVNMKFNNNNNNLFCFLSAGKDQHNSQLRHRHANDALPMLRQRQIHLSNRPNPTPLHGPRLDLHGLNDGQRHRVREREAPQRVHARHGPLQRHPLALLVHHAIHHHVLRHIRTLPRHKIRKSHYLLGLFRASRLFHLLHNGYYKSVLPNLGVLQ